MAKTKDFYEYGRNFRCPSIPLSAIFCLEVDVRAWNNCPVRINMVSTYCINS